MIRASNRRIAWVAFLVLGLDQITKQIVVRCLRPGQEWDVVRGFFKFVHWGNTGAAFTLFDGKNYLLALIGLAALVVLVRARHYFEAHTVVGQFSLGLIFGGILGNLSDRVFIHHVVDFLRFYLYQRGGNEIGFPAFNVADSAICVGVGLLFVLSWKSDAGTARPAQPAA